MEIFFKYTLLSSISIVTILLGIFVIKQRRTVTHIAAFSLFLVSTLSTLFILGREWKIDHNEIPLPWNNFLDTSVALFSLTTVFFALSFPHPIAHFWKVFVPFSAATLAVSGIALAGGIFSKHEVINHVHIVELSPFYPIYSFFCVSMMLTTIGILLFKHQRLRSNKSDEPARKSLAAILVMFTIAIISGFLFSFVLPILLHQIRYFYLLSVPSLIGSIAVFYSIVKYNAFDIETIVHKTLSWLFVSSIPLVSAVSIAVWLRPLLIDAPSWQWGAAMGGMGCLIAIYLYAAQPYIDQLFDRRKYDLSKTLDEIITDLSVLQDLQPMAMKILERVNKVLSIEGAAATVVEPSEERLLVVSKANFQINDAIPIGAVVLREFQKGSALELEQIHHSNRLSEPEEPIQSWLRDHRFALCLPLIQKGDLIGVLCLGRKRNLKRFSRREIAFLTQIGAAATIAFSNSLLLERVRDLDRQKTEFLSEVAHELRGPLLGMSSIAEGILVGEAVDLPRDKRRLIANIRETATDMKDLVDHLLDLSKIEMGVMTYDFREVDVGSVVRLAVDLAAGAIASKGLELAVQMDEPLPMVKGDKSRIRQCVTNLLSNAIKYTDHGMIQVSCTRADEGVRVFVEDTGQGMTQEETRGLFARYRRGSQVSGIEGSGLGLALTKEIVEAHRGRVDVESVVGQGTRISIFLPKDQTEALQPDSALASGRTVDPSDKPTRITNGINGSLPRAVMGNSETLLVVDDSEIDRDVLQSFFEANGYRVITASNGREALQRVREEGPNLIITDMVMPNLSGPQLCRMLKENLDSASIPIIMVTARDNLGEMAFGFQLGADDYASKPCNLKELSLRVAMLLRINRIRNDLELARSRLIEMELIASSSGTLVHAIKNPLGLIQNYIKIVGAEMARANHEKAQEGLSQINEAAQAIAGILHGLRRAHIDPPKMIRVDLAEVVEACITERTEERDTENYRIVRRYGENLPCVEGDPLQLRMAIANLIANAFDAMPNEGVLEVILRSAGPGSVEIDIRDSGTGISDSVRSSLFKPFITTKVHGTGLGLWTAKRVIENNHGGELSLESAPGRGTTAIVRLPLVGRMQTSHQKEVIERGEGPNPDR